MSELAFNANGDSFDIPATVTGWRVRRMKPRGAPELVYGRDGRPLTINIDADIEELREAVGSAGRYRLDPINDDGKCVENVPAAYVQVVKPQRNADPTAAITTVGPSDDAVREAMRLNTELAKSVIDRFPEMMTAAAELLRAADGAGLPSRAPRAIDGDEDEDDDALTDAKPGFDLNAFVAQIIPMIVMGISNGKMPQLGEVLDWRKAAPSVKPKTTKSTKAPRPDGPGDVAAPLPENATDVLPPIDPQTMAHFIAVQSALTPEEGAIAREVAKELGAAELRAWFDELSKLSVPDAVEKVRTLISGFGKNGGAA
ncbi:MAG: hypothetical protein AB7O24_18135 [Kofleriaceae bacterium]